MRATPTFLLSVPNPRHSDIAKHLLDRLQARGLLAPRGGAAFKGVAYYDAAGSCWVVDAEGRRLPKTEAPVREADCFAIFDDARCRGADLKVGCVCMRWCSLQPGRRPRSWRMYTRHQMYKALARMNEAAVAVAQGPISKEPHPCQTTPPHSPQCAPACAAACRRIGAHHAGPWPVQGQAHAGWVPALPGWAALLTAAQV